MRFFHRLLLIGVLHVVRHPRRVLVIAGAVAALCIALAAAQLRLSSDQNKLFDPSVPFFRDYLSFVERFPENEAIYVVAEPIDGNALPPVQRWTALADAIVARLRGMPEHVRAVDGRIPIDRLGAYGLLFDEPQRVHRSLADLTRFIPLVKLWAEEPTTLTRLLGASPLERFISALRTQPPDAETAQFVALLANSWNRAIEQPTEPLTVGTHLPDLASFDAAEPSRLGYYYVPEEGNPSRHLLLVRVYNRTDYTSLTAVTETVEAIRAGVRDAASLFPEFRVGITGRPALEADEMRTTDRDTRRSEVLALIAVFVGLALMLRSVWLALAGEIALGVGIGWTFGWATVSVGELNLLSIVFLLALIGIGMDYLVQVLTRYRQEASRRTRPQTIWISVFRHVAPPINTACLGAAGAFFVSMFTHFRGAAELGIIAGGGLLLCLLAGYLVLPALLTLFPVKSSQGAAAPDLGIPASRGGALLATPVIWLTLLLAGIPLAARTQFDPGLLNMQAPKLESVMLVRKLQTWSAVVLARDLSVLRRARAAIHDSLLVSRTESILDAYDNFDWLRAHESELPTIAWTEPAPTDAAHLKRLAEKAQGLAEHSTGTTAAEVLSQFATLLRQTPSDQTAKRLSEWQRAFIEQLKGALTPFHPPPLDLSQLPPELLGHFVGSDGTFALHVYPREDLWDQQRLGEFVRDLETRLKPINGEFTLTGIAVNIHHSTRSIERSFYQATIYALLLILVLVFIDLRSVGDTLLAVSVLALGLPMLMAVMGLLGVDWNFANFFALPILIGAGHEYGVFLMHRYREAIRDPRRVWRRWDVSDRALLLCAYVTCSSFGFFWAMAHHRGLRSLGLVMALGTGCIYLAALLVLLGRCCFGG